ncbi:glycosyltransferase [Isoptericola sp. AK164]|uniref:glycosyltransferase n=1 Tax=Isoptericola sp. AK164 TaxID=3024246 RepID=UPI0024185968|nr:glycosyltransferase [Isoptericola sp. AK164]
MRILRVSHSAVVDAWRERERELRRLGHDVRLLSARAWDEGGRRVPLRPRPGEPVRGVATLGRHPALFLYAPGPLWRALGEQWDVVDVHEEPFALATAEVLALVRLRAALSRRPPPPLVLYSAQNIAKRYPWPFRTLERAALRSAAGISVCNDRAGRILREKGARGVVATIPLGVELPGRASGTGRAAQEASAPELVRVGYAGRLAPHKGVPTLLEAVDADERLHLEIAGDGPLRDQVTEAADRSARVQWHGPLSGPALAEFYRGLDLLAVPSVDTPGWVEQFGRVAVEAMASGVPVVASRSGALPDVVGDDDDPDADPAGGLLVPPGDTDALRAALLRVGTEPGLADRLRAGALERARSCSWPRVAARYDRLYSRVVDGPQDLGDRPLPEVLVVAYGRPDLLRQALEPLAGKFPLTVVDNSSLPEIREATELAGGRYLDPGRNGGFGAGVNHGLVHRQFPGADVLLLNPDAVVGADDVLALQRALHTRPRTASVGPRQVDAGGTPARVTWPFPSPAGAWAEAVGLRRLRRTRPDRSFVIGSVLLLHADAVAALGGLDERFFLYAEETDWAYRAARAGWHHEVVDDVVATHVGAGTSSDPTVREHHFHASQELYHRKHFGATGWAVTRSAVLAGSAVRAVALPPGRRAEARRRLRLYLRGPVRARAADVATERSG